MLNRNRRHSFCFVFLMIVLISLFLMPGCQSDSKNIGKSERNSLEGEFVIIEDYSYIGTTTQYEYTRAFISKKDEFFLIEAPYKSTASGSLIMGKDYNSEGVVSAFNYYVGDYEIKIKIIEGTVKGSGREDLYLKSADKTVKIIHSGTMVKISGDKSNNSDSDYPGVPIFKVSSVEKIE